MVWSSPAPLLIAHTMDYCHRIRRIGAVSEIMASGNVSNPRGNTAYSTCKRCSAAHHYSLNNLHPGM